MLTIVVTGLVLTRARRLSELLSSSSDVWKEWELRGAVFLSLVLQIILICLGHRRKYPPLAWIKVVTWLAYLSADSVAIYALGLISNMIKGIMASKSANQMDPHVELSTFWAPFLLLHLGGPDTISAYAIEDNELWLRHALTLVYQTGLTVYVLVMAWTHPTLSFLSIFILLSGFYKYGERVWVLRAASNEHFKDSLVQSQHRGKYSDKIVEERELKAAEGYNIVPHQVIEVRNDAASVISDAIVDLLSQKPNLMEDTEVQDCKRTVHALLAAHSLFDTSQHIFADHLFSFEERKTCLSILDSKHDDKHHDRLEHNPDDKDYDLEDNPDDKHDEEIFKIIEIELGLMYDVFYTKAKAIYTRWGFICRLAISLSICVTLVLFSFCNKRRYSNPDLCLTFLLLGAAIFLELYALSHILFSDWVAYWLIKNKKSAIFYFINGMQPFLKRHRLSNSIGFMGQYSLMSYHLKKTNSCWWRFLKLLHMDERAMKFLYQGHEDVTRYIRKPILSKIAEKEAMDAHKLPSLWNSRGGHVLSRRKLLEQLKWSIELDFDMSILVWHIATELCYYPVKGTDSLRELDRNNQKRVKYCTLASLHLSRYMLYLLITYPSMLPVRIGSIRFPDIYKETKKYFSLDESAAESPPNGHNKEESRFDISEGDPGKRREYNPEIANFCSVLRSQVKPIFILNLSKEDKVKYALLNGYRLASQLEEISAEETKWEVIREVWVEMLIYAASKCKARDHAQRMRWGGELITHVYILMAHYGLTDHFQLPHSPVLAEMIVNSW